MLNKKASRVRRRAQDARPHRRAAREPAGGPPDQPAHLRQIIAPEGDKVLASASTVEKRTCATSSTSGGKGGNVAAAKLVGKRIAREGEGARHRDGRVRPLRFPLPWPREGAGRSRPRRRPEVLRQRLSDGRERCNRQAQQAAGTRRRPAREDDRDQPRHQGGEGRAHPRLRGADRRRRRRRPRRHGQGQGEGSAGGRAEGDGGARRGMVKACA